MFFDSVAPLYDGTKETAIELLDWVYDFYQSFFPDATGDDYIISPQVVSGLGVIDWTNAQGIRADVTAPFTLTNYATDGFVFFATDGVTVSAVSKEYSGSITASSVYYDTYRGQYQFNPSNSLAIKVDVAPAFTGYRSYLFTASSSVQYTYGQTSLSSDYRFGLVQSNFSTLKNDPRASVNLPNAGDSIQLNTIKNDLVAELNEQYPDSTQNPDEFLTYDDWIEDATENDSNINFTIDYDEILSEKELEDILTAETYTIDELPTDNLLLEVETLPRPELSPQMQSTSVAVVNDTIDFFDDIGFLSVAFPLTVLSLVFFILKRGR